MVKIDVTRDVTFEALAKQLEKELKAVGLSLNSRDEFGLILTYDVVIARGGKFFGPPDDQICSIRLDNATVTCEDRKFYEKAFLVAEILEKVLGTEVTLFKDYSDEVVKHE